MKFLIAQMSHETNTFSPVVTDLARFEPLYGERDIIKVKDSDSDSDSDNDSDSERMRMTSFSL